MSVRTHPLLLSLLTLLSACGGTTGPEIVDEFDDLTLEQITILPDGNYRAIAFADERTGVVAGLDGAMARTTDGGASWEPIEHDSLLVFMEAVFVSETIGYVVGYAHGADGPSATHGVIRATSDGGASWYDALMTDEREHFSNVAAVGDRFVAAISYGTLFISRDGGREWSQKTFEHFGSLLGDIHFIDENVGFITTGRNVFLRTTDGGNQWERIDHTFEEGNGIQLLSSIGPDTLIGAGRFGLAKSYDSGASWRVIQDSPQRINALHFTDPLRGYALGEGNYSGGDFGYDYASLFVTDDGGETWYGTRDLGNNRHDLHEITAVSFPSADVGYAVGRGVVVKIERRAE